MTAVDLPADRQLDLVTPQWTEDLPTGCPLRHRNRSSKCFADPHAERVPVLALRDVGAQIDVILFAQFVSQSAATGGQKILVPEMQIARRHATNASKGNKAESPGQCKPIFQLCRKHIAVDVATRLVPSQFVLHPVNAIRVERGRTSGSA